MQASDTDLKKIARQMGDDILANGRNQEQSNKNPLRVVAKSGLPGIAPNVLGVSDIPLKYIVFYHLVQTNQPLDLKHRAYNPEKTVKSESEYASLWSRTWKKGQAVDYMGNYLYGYVGQGYLLIGDETLKQAAGIAQGFSDKDVVKWFINSINGNYGDNPGDSKAIQDGIDAYKEANQ